MRSQARDCSAVSWPLTRVQFLTLFGGFNLFHLKILSLYFLCAYPTIFHWPTHFVLKLTNLLFVLSFSTHSKIQKKKKNINQFLWNIWFSLLTVELLFYGSFNSFGAISQYCEHCHYLTVIYSFWFFDLVSTCTLAWPWFYIGNWFFEFLGISTALINIVLLAST